MPFVPLFCQHNDNVPARLRSASVKIPSTPSLSPRRPQGGDTKRQAARRLPPGAQTPFTPPRFAAVAARGCDRMTPWHQLMCQMFMSTALWRWQFSFRCALVAAPDRPRRGISETFSRVCSPSRQSASHAPPRPPLLMTRKGRNALHTIPLRRADSGSPLVERDDRHGRDTSEPGGGICHPVIPHTPPAHVSGLRTSKRRAKRAGCPVTSSGGAAFACGLPLMCMRF